jgi:GTPase SAR1 family protein
MRSYNKQHYRDIPNYQEQTVKNRAVRLWKDLTEVLNTKVNKHNLDRVLADLELTLSSSHCNAIAPHYSPDQARFYGRCYELWQLENWIEVERSKLIFLYGMGGIGKTSLALKLVDNLAPKFDRTIWISLLDAPSVAEILPEIVSKMGMRRQGKLSTDLTTAIEKTIDYLQAQRCLLVFDNVDAILTNQDGSDLSPDYYQFFHYLNWVEHSSCCIAIANQIPQACDLQHQRLALTGLDRESCQQLVETSYLWGTEAEWDILINKYQGNPQYLKIVAPTIRDIFGGKIANFLQENILLYDDIQALVSAQLDRLSPLEIDLLLWLTQEREPITLDRLKTHFQGVISTREILKMLDRLVRKFIIEPQGNLFTLSAPIAEYITECYRGLGYKNIAEKKIR